MLTTLVLTMTLSLAGSAMATSPPIFPVEPYPTGEIGLSPTIEVPVPPKPPVPVRPPLERPGGPTGPFDPTNPIGLGAAAILAVGTLTSLDKRRRKLAKRLFPSDVDVVLVPGHGSEPGQVFDQLTALMGLPQSAAREFDWALANPGAPSSLHASRDAGVGRAADAIEAYVAEIAEGGQRVYIVGYSKGGAAVAEMLSRWDRDPSRRVDGVYGAALLDPPISGGWLGEMQSLGFYGIDMPHDGGYNPMRLRWFGLLPWSEDTREHLGRDAGVETVVFRSPDAFFTNFGDNPRGLRVYDVDDPGPSVFGALFDNPLGRMGKAHAAVVRHPMVARCIADEIRAPGSCEWSTPRAPTIFDPGTSVGGSGMVGNHVL